MLIRDNHNSMGTGWGRYAKLDISKIKKFKFISKLTKKDFCVKLFSFFFGVKMSVEICTIYHRNSLPEEIDNRIELLTKPGCQYFFKTCEQWLALEECERCNSPFFDYKIDSWPGYMGYIQVNPCHTELTIYWY